MILLLGASGYIGQAFAAELTRRGTPFTPLSRATQDYTRFDTLTVLLRALKPTFLINAAGFTGRPNVDACETRRAETLAGNVLLPQTVAHACAAVGIPWGHVSSGCIYDGARRAEADGGFSIVRDPRLCDRAALRGFTEVDEPNFTFRAPPCSFYSGTKALAEEALQTVPNCYIWRLRIPFDEADNARNYLTKLQRYERVYDHLNSLSHRSDYARACLDLWERRAPFGTYNVTNPGFLSARDVVAVIQRVLRPAREFAYWESDEAFYRTGAHAPRSNCILDVSKLLATGVPMRPVQEAVEDALARWSGNSVGR
jgi:dTDP-4-dehydrorhamnose reductase